MADRDDPAVAKILGVLPDEPSVLTGQVPVVQPLRCDNTQCRVTLFMPHAVGSLRGKCPACYGAGS